MFCAHLFNVCVVLFLADLWVLTSFSLLDALNNSLAILILNALHHMGTKFFLKFIYSSNGRITNDPDYLKLHVNAQRYADMHAATSGPLMVNLAISAALLLVGKQFIAFVLDMSVADLCSFATIFGLIASSMILVIATKARKIVQM